MTAPVARPRTTTRRGDAQGVGSSAASLWRAARNILAVRLDNLGDVLMATPAMAALVESNPGARLTLLASPGGARLAPHLPFVAEAIAFEAPWVRHSGATCDDEGALAEQLREHRFDAAVLFTSCTQSALPAALICRLAGIPLRIAHARENPYALLSDWVAERDFIGRPMRHETERQLDLVAAAGFTTSDASLRFTLHAEDRREAAAALARAGLRAGARYFVVHPGASAASRRYPAERFGTAAAMLARRSGCVAVFVGGAGERELVARAQAAMARPSLSLVGGLSLGGLGALLEGAALLVCNNSGPAHLAAALATPVVDLYALTNPQHTPWRVPSRVLSHDVPCRNCLKSACPEGHHDCLRQIAPAQIVTAGLELLSQARVASIAAA